MAYSSSPVFVFGCQSHGQSHTRVSCANITCVMCNYSEACTTGVCVYVKEDIFILTL